MNPIRGPEALSGTSGLGAAGALGSAGRMRSLREMEPRSGITLQLQEGAKAGKADFADTLNEVLREVNEMQLRSDHLMERFAAGEVKDLHEVVIAQQEAAIAFRLVQEVRDKLLQGYQDIMRMQV